MDHVLSLPVRSQMKKNAVTIRDERTRKKNKFFFSCLMCVDMLFTSSKITPNNEFSCKRVENIWRHFKIPHLRMISSCNHLNCEYF